MFRKQKTINCILTLFFFLPASAAFAKMCTLDAVPAATLLLPYFEVDLDNPNGANTLFTVHNATAEPSLAHITLWTNYSQPTIDFDLFLTGYDMQVVNMREIFDDGNLPITADEQSDPSDTISPHAAHPEWDGSFTADPNCINFFPSYVNPLIVGSIAERLINGHTGKPITSLGDQCLGADLGDNVARGYVTIDHSQRCALDFPSDVGYFGGFEPVASDENRLWGDFVMQNPEAKTQIRDTLVHIEADPDFDQNGAETGYTFYGRYSGGEDHREPLSGNWGVRYLNDAEAGLTSDWIVWRDSTSNITPQNGLECQTPPDWFPLDETSVLCLDEQEDDVELCGGPGEACFPYETQKVRVGQGALTLPYSSGWCLLDLNADDSFFGDVDFPIPGSPVSQSYVVVVNNSSSGVYASGSRATALGTSCEIPASFSGFFADGFESGNTSAWTLTTP